MSLERTFPARSREFYNLFNEVAPQQITINFHHHFKFSFYSAKMASPYEVEVTIRSANDLKNVNWRHGLLRPYAVVWVDPNKKCSTRVDEAGDMCPVWDQTLVIPLPPGPIEEQTLCIDIVHAGAEEDTKKLIGSARLKLSDVLDDVGFGERVNRNLQLKRPSGRPQGKLDVKVVIRESRYRAPDPHYAPPYGVPPPAASRDYSYGTPRDYYGTSEYYSAAPPPPNPYYSTAPPSGYPYSGSGYNAPPPPQAASAYGQPSYGYGYGEQQAVYKKEEKKSKFGMGTGLAVGAVAGVLGGLAISEGVDALEDNIADRVEEKLEDEDEAEAEYDGGDDDF